MTQRLKRLVVEFFSSSQKQRRRKAHSIGLSFFLLLISGCSNSAFEIDGAVQTVNILLSESNCSAALLQVEPYFNSSQSNNDIRMAMGSVYGCFAGLNFFNFLQNLTQFNGDLEGGGLWEFLSQEFPSKSTPVDDKIPESAEYGIDAILSALKPGIVLVPADLLQYDKNNIQSLLIEDRIDDANSYVGFLAMALMGSLLSRYGQPLANYHKSVSLPFTTPASIPGDGCSLSAGLLLFQDSVDFIIEAAAENLSSEVFKSFTQIQSFLNVGTDTACQLGCMACGISCPKCPMGLRDRKSCTGQSSDIYTCAALGLLAFMNSTWAGPP